MGGRLVARSWLTGAGRPVGVASRGRGVREAGRPGGRAAGVGGRAAGASSLGLGPPEAGPLCRADSQRLESGSPYCLELSHSRNTKKIGKSLNV